MAFMNARAMVFSKSHRVGKSFRAGSTKIDFFLGVALAWLYLPQKARRGRFNAPPRLQLKEANQ